MEQLPPSPDANQIPMDKEMNGALLDIATVDNLQNEVEAAREASSKITSSTNELADMQKKLAASEEALKRAKDESERQETKKLSLEEELKEKQSKLTETQCGLDTCGISRGPDDDQCSVSTT